MKLSRRDVDDVVLFDVSGNIQGGPDATRFHDEISSLLEAGKRKVVLDLSDVGWMNSSGVGIIITGYTSLKNAGGRLVLVNIKDRVRSVLMVTRLLTVFESYYTEEEALAALRQEEASTDARSGGSHDG